MKSYLALAAFAALSAALSAATAQTAGAAAPAKAARQHDAMSEACAKVCADCLRRVRKDLPPLRRLDGGRQEGARRGGARHGRLRRVLQDVRDPLRPVQHPLPGGVRLLREVLRRLRRRVR